MSKTSKLILTALTSVFLAGSAAFLASQNFDNAIEAKATTVSDLAGLQAALVGADENTVIYVDTSIDIKLVQEPKT